MGNCCKKKKDECQFVDIENSENNNNNKVDLLTLKNKGGKNYNDKDDDSENESKIKGNYNFEVDDNKIDSSTQLKAPKETDNKEEDNNKNKNNKLNKNVKKYEKIIFDYLKLKENIGNKKQLLLYIINKSDNDDIISIYNSVIENKDYKLLKSKASDKKKKEIIINAINSYMKIKTEFNKDIKVYNYEECKENLKNKVIDIVDKNFIKGMGLKVNKENETKYIDNYDNDNIILEFIKKKKRVKIEKRNEKFYLREFLDEINISIKNSIFEYSQNDIIINDPTDFNNNKSNLKENNNSINKTESYNLKNSVYDKNQSNEEEKTSSLNKIKLEMNNNLFQNKLNQLKDNNDNEILIIIFKVLILYNLQNANISKKEKEENFDNNEYYYLINKNIIINLKNEINDKNNENIDEIINDYILNQRIEDFEEIQNSDITEFKTDYSILFKKDYDFSKIKFKELLPNDKKIINQINNDIINYPSDFILIKPLIYDYLIKLIKFEDKSYNNGYYEILKKYSAFFSGNQIYLKNITDESNIIYVGERLNDVNINEFQSQEYFNISYILKYNLKDEFIKEYNLFIKNYDIGNYIQKRKLKININQTKSIINEKKEKIGFFINLKNNNNLILETDDIDNKNEINDSYETIAIAINNNLINENDEKKSKNIDIDINFKNKNNFIINEENNKNDFYDLIIKDDNDSMVEKNKNENENNNESIIKGDKDLDENKNNNESIIKGDKDLDENKNNNELIIKGDKDLIFESNKNGDNLENVNNNKNNLATENEEKEKNGEKEKEFIKEKELIEKSKNEGKSKPILVGLRNIKNSSSVNSLLQCMYKIPQLTHYFISNNLFNIEFENIVDKELIGKEKNDMNENINNKDTLSYKYYEVIYHLYYKIEDSKIIKAYSPKNFLEYIEKADPSLFNMNKKLEPKILFIFLISKIKKELNKKENLKDIDSLEFNIKNSVLTNVDSSNQLYQNYLSDFRYKNNSVIDKFFSGIKGIIVYCQKCKHHDYRFESFYYITLPLSDILKNSDDKQKITVYECLEKKYSKGKSIIKNFTKKCANCNEMSDLFYSNQIFLGPKTLVIILDDVTKKMNYLNLSLKLDINEFLIEKNRGYELIGIITYFKEEGINEQYIAYCKIKEEQKWYCCCDDCIFEVDDPEKDMEKSNRWPYILFYNEISIKDDDKLIEE